ncbi:MAG: hypothetical protein JXO22_08500, partial [Phycisphaerae bacterium]|nr:hypothetical protein [Phycisphaerae bacterium]
MLSHQTPLRFGLLMLAVSLMALSTAAADTTLVATANGALATAPDMTTALPVANIQSAAAAGLNVTIDFSGLTLTPHKTTDGQVFVQLDWPEAAYTGEVGSPRIPVWREVFVAPPGATVLLSASATTPSVAEGVLDGQNLRLIPVQPPIEKLPGARENAVLQYDTSAYAVDADFPIKRATISELGIFRGQRLMLLEVRPVAYNPAAERVTFYPQITVDLTFTGDKSQAPAVAPLPGLASSILNPGILPVAQSRGSGNYLIIVAQAYESDIAAFATAKAAQGFTVSTYSVPSGTSNSTIKTYIQSLWGGANSPDYILLVGDTNTIPHWTGGGTGSPDTDLPYTCMDGSTDWYPDIAIGRFPARSSGDVADMVSKTLYYENGPLADPAYTKRAVFMAGNDNYSITEGTHEYVINNYMIPNGYTFDRLYEVSYGASPSDVTAAFNNGRLYGIYSGHGSTDEWADGPEFTQSNVNALTNTNMYAVVFSFACLTGQYSLTECFMETWVLAPNKAAVTSCGSSVTSYWDEDDILEKRLFDVIFDNTDNVKTEIGPVINETRVRYLAHFGPTSTTRRYFEMYNLMGDPSMRLPSACPDAGEISLDRNNYACSDSLILSVDDCGLNLDDNLIDTVDVTVESTSESTGETVTLYETDVASASFEGTLPINTVNAVGVLLVAEGDTITATYVDADDGQGGTNVVVTDTALVDCSPPSIFNVQTLDVQPHSATIGFDADEPVRGIIHYGSSCGTLNQVAYGSGYSTTPTVTVSSLSDDATYYYTVEAEDEAGNLVVDTNGGMCYT